MSLRLSIPFGARLLLAICVKKNTRYYKLNFIEIYYPKNEAYEQFSLRMRDIVKTLWA